jgi:lipoprotein signal peptidase
MNHNRPVDITALSLFFAFGGLMCAAAALMIFSSGGVHSVWRLVPAIATLGTEAVSWLVLVSTACFVVAFGLWRNSSWGFFTASMLLVLGLIAHFWRAVSAADWGRVLVVVTIGVLVGLYLRNRADFFVHRGP